MYTPEFELAVRAWAKSRQKEKRFAHTARVVATATRLAEKWSPEDVTICRLAGWIHDAAKEMPDDELLKYAQAAGLPITEAEYHTPMLLHGAVAYAMASEKFGFKDDRIRSACAYHTTGSPEMNLADKIVYLADLIEPARDFPSIDRIRHLAYSVDINKAMLFSVVHTVRYLTERERPIDPRVLGVYNVLVTAGVSVK